MTWDEIKRVVGRVQYPGFAFQVDVIGTHIVGGAADHWEAVYAYLQVECWSADNDEPSRRIQWKSRKWLLSQHMTEGEVVQTCLMATLAALEHEAREKFTYEGTRLFDPHFDIRKLMALRQSEGSILERTPLIPS